MTPPARDDEQLLMLIVAKDRDALEALYDKYASAVFSLAMHMLRDPGASEEVTQDVFFNVWRRASSYHAQRGSVKSWLFSVAHHRTIDELRRRRREQPEVQRDFDLNNSPSDDSGDPVAQVTTKLDGGQLRDALEALRPEQREVVMLAYFGGLTHSEIARQLGQPLGTVKTRMRLALKRLKEVLGPRIQESADHGV
jgi:RNA polymerase sigma-70 factor (ECF subfamily)